MTTQTWINRPGGTIPDWVAAHMNGHQEANGSFLIRTRCGKEAASARVHVGDWVICHMGTAYARPPEEVSGFLGNLKAEEDAQVEPTAIGPGKAFQTGAKAPSAAPKREPVKKAKTGTGGDRKMAYAPPVGNRPSIEWIRVSDLMVDETYQRRTDNHASRRLIASIAAKFDWRLFGVLTVSRRPDDTMAVIDGQHRWSAAAMRGDIVDVPCCLTRFGTPEEEAKLFIVANRARKPMNRLDDFHAALRAGDDDALEIQRLVTEAGLTIARNTSSTAWAPGEIAFTAAIASALRKHGPGVVSAALTDIAEAFPGQQLKHGGSIFNGLVRILAHPPEGFDPDQFFKGLLAFDAEGWGSFMTGLKGGDTRGQAMRQAMLEAYNDQQTEKAA